MEGKLEIVKIKDAPMHTIHIDHFGPLEETKNGFKHILVAVDAFIKYVWLFPCKSTTTNKVISHVNTLINLFGCLERIISDRGTAFSSKVFTSFLQENYACNDCGSVAVG